MLTGPIGLLGLVYFPSVCPPTGPRVYVLRTRRLSRERARVRLYARIRTRRPSRTGVEQVRKTLTWTRQILFVRFSYVGDAAPSLGPSAYLRSILLLATLTVFIFLGEITGDVCPLSCSHRDAKSSSR